MVQSLMTNRLEDTILSHLIHNEDYCRKVLPFLKDDYFASRSDKVLFSEIYAFVDKYNNLPTKETLIIELGNRKDITEEEYKAIKQTINGLSYEENDIQWLLDTTEKFCKDKAVNNAVLNGIKILDGKDKKRTPEPFLQFYLKLLLCLLIIILGTITLMTQMIDLIGASD